MKDPKPIILDGRTGEGGGQLVRLAVALSAVSSQPIRISNVTAQVDGSLPAIIFDVDIKDVDFPAFRIR